jgi:hypothetical protein
MKPNTLYYLGFSLFIRNLQVKVARLAAMNFTSEIETKRLRKEEVVARKGITI